MKDRRGKSILIGVLCATLVFMGIGYATMYQALNVQGTATIEEWDIAITGITQSYKSSDVIINNPATYSYQTATFDVSFVMPGDYITYAVPLTNGGTLDAQLASINIKGKEADEPIDVEVTGITEGQDLLAGQSTTAYVTITYNEDATGNETQSSRAIDVTFNFQQK